MLKDVLIEQDTNWSTRVGPTIGGVPPTTYGMKLHPLDSPIREFYVKDPPWANWLAYSERKVLPNTGKLSLLYELFVDSNSLIVTQAIEFDTKLAIGGFIYNFSSQFNYVTGQWQASGVGGWKDTGWKFGKFTPGVPYRMQFDYAFDIVKKTYGFMHVKALSDHPDANTGSFTPPFTPFQSFTAEATNWTDTCNIQVQQDLNGGGGAFSIYMREIAYQWQ